MEFRTKLLLSYIVVILLITGSFYIYFDHSLQQAMIEESRINLSRQTELAKLLVMSNQQDQKKTPQQLSELIGTVINSRVTLISPEGTVTGDSDVGSEHLAQLENHLKRPEIQNALKNGTGTAQRYSETLRTSMLYSAITYGNGKTDGIIRLAMPLEYLTSTRNSLHGMVGGASLVTIIIALIFSYILSSLTSKPLRDMADAATNIGHTSNKTKIPVTSNDEIGMLGTVLNEMSDRIEDQMQRLSADKQRLDVILRSMGEGVMVTTPDGVITLVNPAFHTLFSIAGEVEGKNLVEISRHPNLLESFNDLVKPDVKELIREISLTPNGTTLLTHWVPLNVNGVRQGVVAVFHDISDIKNAENMRRDFVANVSHELRTPVTIIKGYSETLLNGVLQTDLNRATRFVEIISTHSDRLSNLINDVLTLSSLETKEALIEIHPTDVSKAILNTCTLLHESAEKKGISVQYSPLDNNVPLVMADQGRLEQILINLLENAIKYTPAGGSIRIFSAEEDKYVKTSVADSGIGIPLKDMPRIFERFYRVDEARTREQGGTGLGLAIVKHIVQLQGGDVSVTSETGKGSVFSFTTVKA
ncbi:MAG: ATP-binding protein [Desulfuromonadaceae bacterium]|nr:ATP-binding protein [Desulfuromonadaceae bacterium]MDD2854691.1 ATP-binding protein [Desulfuromonadaceae bacterium]